VRTKESKMDLSGSLEIRMAEIGDAAAISSLLVNSFEEYQSLYTPEGYAATAITSEQVANRIIEGPIWVAISSGNVVGTVSVVIRKDSLYIRGMAVRPTARGRRIGELLMAEVEKFSRSEGFRRLFLSTTPFLHRAIRLYERLGFQRIDESPSDLHGTPLFTMEKFLP
jgi:N-acetylglutamate synthase-like GNAT family acetyltransferase